MEYIYSIQVDKKILAVSFQDYVSEKLDNRQITTCSVVELPTRKIYSGATIRNPNDKESVRVAYTLSYKRAIFNLWSVKHALNETKLDFFSFMKLYKKALENNFIYQSERKMKWMRN
jgi:hypothetical protein